MFEYTGIVSEITGDFRFILVDNLTKGRLKVNCDVSCSYLKEIVKLLEIGEKITVKGEEKTSKVDYLTQKMEVEIKVLEIID